MGLVVSDMRGNEDREQVMCKLSFLSSVFSQSGDVVLNDKDKIGLVCILDEIRLVCDPGEVV